MFPIDQTKPDQGPENLDGGIFLGVITGLRYYSPRLGRWTSKDPIGERGDCNLTVFVTNCPLNFTDAIGDAKVYPTDSNSKNAGFPNNQKQFPPGTPKPSPIPSGVPEVTPGAPPGTVVGAAVKLLEMSADQMFADIVNNALTKAQKQCYDQDKFHTGQKCCVISIYWLNGQISKCTGQVQNRPCDEAEDDHKKNGKYVDPCGATSTPPPSPAGFHFLPYSLFGKTNGAYTEAYMPW